MGRTERVCAGCQSAWSEYDESLTCSECYDQYFVACGCAGDVTSLAGVGLVCDDCNNYNTPSIPNAEDLYEFLLEKYELSHDNVALEWSAKQPTRPLPCFRCKSKICKLTHETEIDLTKKEIKDMDSRTSLDHFGQCCICAKKDDPCVDCESVTTTEPENKKIKF